MVDAENQTEFDSNMTVRALGDLEMQGLPESYEKSIEKEPTHFTSSALESDQEEMSKLPMLTSNNDCHHGTSSINNNQSSSVDEGIVSECIVSIKDTITAASINDCALSTSFMKDDESTSFIKDAVSKSIIKDDDISCTPHLMQEGEK